MLTSCGSISGHTKPIKIKSPATSAQMPSFSLAMIDYDEGKMLETNTTPFKWKGARFSQEDLNNLEISIKNSIPAISGSLEKRFINIIVRANLIAYGSGIVNLSAVSWCLSNDAKESVFEDNFFVSIYYGPTSMYTLGGVKEEVMEKTVSRIILTAARMENGQVDVNPVSVDDVYDSYAEAVEKLPDNITFIAPTAGALLALATYRKDSTDWSVLNTMKPLAWDEILKNH